MSWILTRLLNWYSLQIYSKHPRSRLYSSALKKVWVVWTWALNCVVERRQKSLARSEKVVLIQCTCASSTLSEEFSPNLENSFNFLFSPVTTARIFSSHFRRIEMFSPILPLACATNVFVFFFLFYVMAEQSTWKMKTSWKVFLFLAVSISIVWHLRRNRRKTKIRKLIWN